MTEGGPIQAAARAIPTQGTEIALGLMELCSIARGIQACDALLKKAPITLIQAGSVDPGKYTVVLTGGVDEVFEAMKAGERVAAECLIDRLLLPQPHPQLITALGRRLSAPLEALGVLETYSVASVIRGADAALKAAEVQALHLRLAHDLGGKGVFVFTGLLHDVEEAMRAGRAAADAGLIAGAEILANPHESVLAAIW